MRESLLTVEELSQWLKLPKGSIYNLVHERVIPVIRAGRRLRFDPVEIRRWLETCTHREDGPPPPLEDVLAGKGRHARRAKRSEASGPGAGEER